MLNFVGKNPRMASVFRVLKPSVTFKEIAALMKELDTGEGFSNEKNIANGMLSVAKKREWDEIALILLIHCFDILIHDWSRRNYTHRRYHEIIVKSYTDYYIKSSDSLNEIVLNNWETRGRDIIGTGWTLKPTGWIDPVVPLEHCRLPFFLGPKFREWKFA